MVSGHSVQPFGRPWRLADDLLLRFGSDGDAAVALVSSANSADAEVTNLIEGTSDHQGTAANSLVFSNVTNDGDIQMLVSDNGDSKEFLLADGDAAILYLGHGMASTSFSDGNITNVGNIALDTISSDAGTTVSVTLGTDAGDNFVVGNNSALVVEGDTDWVGIGTATPAYPLTVQGANAKIQIKATANDAQTVGLYFANQSTEYAGWINYDDVNDELDLSVSTGVRAQIKSTGVVVNNGDIVFEQSVDSTPVADEVSLGAFEISGGRALAISQEVAVATSVDETDFSHNLPVRINGTTYYIMLASSIS